MSENLEGGAVEVRDGHFFINEVEVTKDDARAAGWTPEQDPTSEAPSGAETDSEADAGVEGGDNVLGRLRAGYKAGQGERRKTIEIAPGRYDSLAAEFKPVDWDLRRKLIRTAGRKGEAGHEADLRINSVLMADACVSMLFRPEPGKDYVQLHTLVKRFATGEPIRFDSRLAEVLGMELIGGESEGDICRLVFGDTGVFEAHYMILNGWSLQAFDDDPEDEEDEGGGPRPI